MVSTVTHRLHKHCYWLAVDSSAALPGPDSDRWFTVSVSIRSPHLQHSADRFADHGRCRRCSGALEGVPAGPLLRDSVSLIYIFYANNGINVRQ